MSATTWLLAVLLLAPAQIELDRESYEVYLCPLHRDEQATGPDDCPVCGREMVQRVLVPSYSCPMHQHIDETEEGACPVCGMALVPTTRELQWYCEDRPEIVASTPAACPDGAPMQMRSVPMAHGDHNPRHGGVLFMAPDGFHHLEGTLDDDGTFRLYFYNDFTKPIDARAFEARAGDAPLLPEADGAYLTASLPPPANDPTEVGVDARFPGTHEEVARFDFVFVAGGVVEAPALPEFRIPETAEEIFGSILERDRRLKELIAAGTWPDLYIPALEAKDLVLALIEREPAFSLPAKKLVRAAWLLDTYGDMGNRERVEDSYALFEEAIRELRDVDAN